MIEYGQITPWQHREARLREDAARARRTYDPCPQVAGQNQREADRRREETRAEREAASRRRARENGPWGDR